MKLRKTTKTWILFKFFLKYLLCFHPKRTCYYVYERKTPQKWKSNSCHHLLDYGMNCLFYYIFLWRKFSNNLCLYDQNFKTEVLRNMLRTASKKRKRGSAQVWTGTAQPFNIQYTLDKNRKSGNWTARDHDGTDALLCSANISLSWDI